jgi:hypothetical protein
MTPRVSMRSILEVRSHDICLPPARWARCRGQHRTQELERIPLSLSLLESCRLNRALKN